MSLIRFRLGKLFPIVCLVTLSAVAGCASSTVLQSQPPGARLSLNGIPVGVTPYTMIDTNIVTSTTQVRLEYPGYQPLDAMVARNEEIDPVALVVGIIVWPVLLWVTRYHPVHIFTMQPESGAPPATNGWGPPPPQGYPPPAPGPAGYPPPPPGYPPPAPQGYPPPAPQGYPPPQ